MSRFEPIQDRVFIEPDPIIKEKSGLSLSADKRETAQIGTIVAVGPGKPGEEMQCRKGDRVLFGKYAGIIHNEGSENELFIMRESEILSIIKK